MSTRMSIYYEEDGPHIYKELASDWPGLTLEYEAGGFCVNIPLSERLSQVIITGIPADKAREYSGFGDPE